MNAPTPSSRLRPLVDLSPTARAAVRGVVFDIDDTLTRGGQLEREAFDALYALREGGVRLWAITGRPLGWAQVFAAHWPIEGAIGENGAGWWWRDGHTLRRGYYQRSETRRDAQKQILERIARRARAELPQVRLASDQGARAHDLAFDIAEMDRHDDATQAALVALIEDEGARAVVSSVHCHAVPGAWNKARGIERASAEVSRLPIETLRSQWVFVGDSANDEEAFAAFPLSVGVANVTDHLDRMAHHPAYVTHSDRGRGFAELARALLDARPSAGTAP